MLSVDIDGAFVGSIVGGVFGGIIFIMLMTGLLFWWVCRKKLAQGQVLHPSQANQS
jgi:uncharacterized iron-regulated membrane protein